MTSLVLVNLNYPFRIPKAPFLMQEGTSSTRTHATKYKGNTTSSLRRHRFLRCLLKPTYFFNSKNELNFLLWEPEMSYSKFQEILLNQSGKKKKKKLKPVASHSHSGAKVWCKIQKWNLFSFLSYNNKPTMAKLITI